MYRSFRAPWPADPAPLRSFGAALTPGILVLDSVVNLAAVLICSLLLAELADRLGLGRTARPGVG